MTLLTTERPAWHCEHYTAELESAACSQWLIARVCCGSAAFYVAVRHEAHQPSWTPLLSFGTPRPEPVLAKRTASSHRCTATQHLAPRHAALTLAWSSAIACAHVRSRAQSGSSYYSALVEVRCGMRMSHLFQEVGTCVHRARGCFQPIGKCMGPDWGQHPRLVLGVGTSQVS